MESAAPPHQTTNEGESGVFECNICLEQAHEPVVTFCGHLFCWSCLWRWIQSGHNVCPVCKSGVARDKVIPLYGRGSERPDQRSTRARASVGGADSEERGAAAASSAAGSVGATGSTTAGSSDVPTGLPGEPNSATGGASTPAADDNSAVPNRPSAQRVEPPEPPFGGGAEWGRQWMGDGMMGGGAGGIALTAGFGFFPSLFALQFSTVGFDRPRNAGPPTREEQHQLVLSRLLLSLGAAAVLYLMFL